MNEFTRLLKTMETLRDPETGCPWDKAQTLDSLKEYIIEEAYELVDAIESKDPVKITEELGDLLLQIVFASQIMKESGKSAIPEVIKTLLSKLVRRHPHIFGEVDAKTPLEVKNNWENIKREEGQRVSILSDYPVSMPALSAAKRYGEQASSVGFDWGDPGPALEKVEEEIAELKREIAGSDKDKTASEIGDLLFSVANVARLCDVNPELALRDANKKFKKRFRSLEQKLMNSKIPVKSISLNEMNKIWESVKEEESGS